MSLHKQDAYMPDNDLSQTNKPLFSYTKKFSKCLELKLTLQPRDGLLQLKS